jgi:hypothetical protein
VSQVLNGNEQPDQPGLEADLPGDTAGAGGRKPLTPQQKKLVMVAVVLNAIIASFTWRDLRRRPASLVRGPKLLWRVWSSLNTTGSVAYWLVGRRRVPAGVDAI